MSQTFQNVLRLIEKGEILISAHGYDELAQDNIRARDILASSPAVLVTAYRPDPARWSADFTRRVK